MLIVLPNREARVDMFHIARTYAGVLEGRPMRDQMLGPIKQRSIDLWGRDREIVLKASHGDYFPEWTAYAWLSSGAIADGCGSHLFLIFFVESGEAACLPRELVRRALEGVKWEECAKDWWP